MDNEQEFSGYLQNPEHLPFVGCCSKLDLLSTCFRWTRILKLRNFPLAGRPLVVESGPWSSFHRFGETFVKSLLHVLNSDYSLKDSLAFSLVLLQFSSEFRMVSHKLF